MTRIITGKYAGVRLEVPRKGTRPTTDRVREAVLGSLEARGLLDEAVVLDLCAGSGALGLEALSRGAKIGYFVDNDRDAIRSITTNIQATRAAGKIYHYPVDTMLTKHKPVPCTIVFCDPPYNMDNSEIEHILTLLLSHHWLSPHAMIIIERSKHSPALNLPDSLELMFTRRYGDTLIYGIEFYHSSINES